MMHIAILEVRLDLPGVRSLKEKRSVVKPLLLQVRNRFHVAVAEVEHQDLWQTAGLGFVAVGSDARVLQGVLQKIVDFIEESGTCVLSDFHVEVIS